MNMDPQRIKSILDRLNVPEERRLAVTEKIMLIWADRVEESVIAAEAEGFTHVRNILDRIKHSG